MTEQLHRDRLSDTKEYLERFSQLAIEIAMLKVASSEAVSKGLLSDELVRLMDQVRKERERAMSEMKTEMKGAFSDALRDALSDYSQEQARREDARAEQQRKTVQLYTRMGIALLIVLLAKDAGSIISAGRMMIGFP